MTSLYRHLTPMLLTLISAISAPSASALTAKGFAEVCAALPGECHATQFAQAYVGGALDFVAVLHEHTGHLAGPIYCKEPKAFFDTKAIINYMLANAAAAPNDNAMRLVVAYLEKEGGC
jgi:hypothetical protein